MGMPNIRFILKPHIWPPSRFEQQVLRQLIPGLWTCVKWSSWVSVGVHLAVCTEEPQVAHLSHRPLGRRGVRMPARPDAPRGCWTITTGVCSPLCDKHYDRLQLLTRARLERWSAGPTICKLSVSWIMVSMNVRFISNSIVIFSCSVWVCTSQGSKGNWMEVVQMWLDTSRTEPGGIRDSVARCDVRRSAS